MELKGDGRMKRYSLLLLIAVLFAACHQSHDYSPKPRGYYRILFPKKEYQQYEGGCPFTFLYPKYAVIVPDSSRGAQNCWLNMRFPQFRGTLHMSYQPVTSKKTFNELTEDARTFAFKHTVKATSIDQGLIRFPERQLYGIYYTIDGNAASSAQFFLTDSVHHYLRCALYFYTEPRLDSIAPVLDFVKKDMNVMINSFRWK